jgi:hypothetical protein
MSMSSSQRQPQHQRSMKTTVEKNITAELSFQRRKSTNQMTTFRSSYCPSAKRRPIDKPGISSTVMQIYVKEE